MIDITYQVRTGEPANFPGGDNKLWCDWAEVSKEQYDSYVANEYLEKRSFETPITKACGKADCKYSWERCGRACFECGVFMVDFGD